MPSTRCPAGSALTVNHVDVTTHQGPLHSNFLANNSANSKHLFHKKHHKSNVFALGPQAHTGLGGTPDFGKDFRWKIGRQGDYLLNNWIRAEISSVKANASLIGTGLVLRWTHNVGHNLFEDIDLSFSQVSGASFDEFYLDFFSAFSVPAGKRNMYDNMIGNLPELVNPIYDVLSDNAQVLPAFVLNVPIPMPYTRNIGIALPTGGLIYNEVSISVCLRDWDELLVVSNAMDTVSADGVAPGYSRQATRADLDADGIPTIELLQLWGNYAVVTSDERKRIGKVPRDMIWEIIQSASDTSVQTSTASTMAYLRYSHAVKVLFIAMRNNTVKGQLSNYTTRQALCYSVTSGALRLSATEFPAPNAFDPIDSLSLKYEGSDRLASLPADFFSMVQPFYFSYSAPTITGYHVFSYSTSFVDIDHAGSTDYGKLTNVSVEVNLGDDAQSALAGAAIAAGKLPFFDERGVASALPPGYLALAAQVGGAHLNGSLSGAGVAVNQDSGFNAVKQTYELKNSSLAHTVVRAIGGGIGFPIY